MRCASCHEKVNQKDKICPHCGQPTRKDASTLKAVLWVVAALAAVGVLVAVNMLQHKTVNSPERTDTGAGLASQAPPGATPFFQQAAEAPVTSSVPIPTVDPALVIDSEPLLSLPAEDPKPQLADSRLAEGDALALVQAASAAAASYLDQFRSTLAFVSKNGYFFSWPAKMYVTGADLLDLTDLTQDQASHPLAFLYIRPADLGRQGTDLAVYAACRTGDTVIIAGDGQEVKRLSPGELDKLLAPYSWDQGDPRRYMDASAANQAIIAALPKSDKGYDVRHLYGNGVYAALVASPVSQPASIKEYVLKKGADGWAVVLDGLEGMNNRYQTVNAQLPDLDLRLLPAYELTMYLKYVKADFSGLIAAMIQQGSIEKADGDPTFISGTDEFVYMEFGPVEKFICYHDKGDTSGTWKVTAIFSCDDARTLMDKYATFNPPPYFLVKQG